jgi:hypothetical protein
MMLLVADVVEQLLELVAEPLSTAGPNSSQAGL